ncbi:hypothetical protein MGYG_06581 [Nannizzia gypsea CBS 118893]|uniref:HTH psq-type domain-containing protein n=1 Tax=Arthroderma gypseum (strain ATCC MYA-4604 / CBS 118893) TaxID=535722 RepID=E4UZQ3_ARTGP|nr:hypothetical protein MGYG_06581 [Nannizzia gypsea CBS 118893]EFR03583.1 hypothetical protein MGYG_06581 [Nannizzia gypsea CBS 118893]
MVSEEAIAAAIADLELQDVLNISETARRFKINRVTLSRRYRGVIGSRAEATSIFYKREAIAKYNITPENIYNFDEKGFLIGLEHAVKRIIPIYL